MEIEMTALTAADLEGIASDEVVDARGAACPGPLLEAKKAIGGIAVGGVVELWSSDPVTRSDVSAWAGKVGHEMLGVLEADGYDRLFIKRGK
jgi:tRNA 2-thiouridine synthesizing protein A